MLSKQTRELGGEHSEQTAQRLVRTTHRDGNSVPWLSKRKLERLCVGSWPADPRASSRILSPNDGCSEICGVCAWEKSFILDARCWYLNPKLLDKATCSHLFIQPRPDRVQFIPFATSKW